jgi:hypothetical protein
MAGFSRGKGACGQPNTEVHTPGLRTTRQTEESRPTSPPASAPVVVVPFHRSDMRMMGKFALAAMAKVSPTIYAMFWCSKSKPN